MNNLAFQIYGTKKATPFQSVWKTDQAGAVSVIEQAGITATGTLTNWAPAGTTLVNGGYTHTAGSAAVLQFGLVPTQGQSYRIICVLSAGSTGSVVINWGGMSSVAISATTTITLTPKTAATLSITPSSSFVGTVSLSIKQSSSATNQIQLPISIASGKSIWVDWGDGQYSTMNNSNIIENRIHTYAASGEYPVRVFGDNFTFGFGNGGFNDRLKLKSISSWGKLQIGSNSFNGCSNVTMSGITDIPDLTGITSLSYTFSYCALLTTIGRMNEWNTSLVTDMSNMFNGSPLFNDNIGSWNVSSVTTFANMFNGASKFNNGSNTAAINNWNIGGGVTGTITLASMFQSASAFNRDISGWDVSKVNSFSGIFAYAINFENGLNTNQNPVTLRTGLDGWNFVATGIDMYGVFLGASKFNRPLSNWNTTNVGWMLSMFNNATSFNQDISKWNVGKVASYSEMFNGAKAFNNGGNSDNNSVTGLPGINGWNINTTAASVNMSSMFKDAFAFNREVSSWNVSKVTSFGYMFFMTYNVNNVFNNGDNNQQNPTTLLFGLDGWNINTTSTSIDFSRMFYGAKFFNRPIGSWNMNKATNVYGMFEATFAFNQPLSNWERVLSPDTSTMGNVTNMVQMFSSAAVFNQDISNWNVSKVTDFANMFGGAIAFTNGLNTNTNLVTGLSGINGWNINTTATSVSMASMFNGATAFNRNIGSWNVSKVTSMGSMFDQAIVFNQSLSNWERVDSTLSNVTTMERMFYQATAFNNGLAVGLPGTLTWNTIGVTTMSQMFESATSFNCNVGGFNVSACSNFIFMFRSCNSFNNGNNASIGNWILKTTGFIPMDAMFQKTFVFNQPIGSWNVSRVTNMRLMFSESAFNQNIGSWNVSNVSNFTDFMNTKTTANFSTPNLDAIYNGWIVNGVKPNTTSPLSTNISFGTAKYSQAGKPGRDTLLASPNNWRIADGLLTVSGTSNNGGLIRLTTNTNGFTTGTSVLVNVYDVTGTIAANGTWTALVISSTIIQLQGSTYDAAWTGGGNVILG